MAATLVLDRNSTTPMDALFSFLGKARYVTVEKKNDERIVLSSAISRDDIDPADYADDTEYLNAIPGMAESILESVNAPDSEFKPVSRKFFSHV